MKIYSGLPVYSPTDAIRTKRDGQGGAGQQQYENQHQKEREKREPADEKQVAQAVESFQVDAQAAAHGLQAAVEGQGPGLRVVLKDGSGAVVRQLSGEEFLRLREATAQGLRRGKILDQKL